MIVISDSVMPTVAIGVGAEAAHEEDVHHREHRLHEHLEHHRHREQHDGAADRRLGVVLVRAADGFADSGPEGRV